MGKEIEITSINLTIGKKEIVLTIDEAKKLKRTLEALFEKETVIKEVHHHNKPHWFWNYPTYPATYLSANTGPQSEPYFKVKIDNNTNGLAQLLAKL